MNKKMTPVDSRKAAFIAAVLREHRSVLREMESQRNMIFPITFVERVILDAMRKSE